MQLFWNFVDTFATCGFNVRMRKYASNGPRLSKFDKQKFVTCYTFGGHTNIAGGTDPAPGCLLDSPVLDSRRRENQLANILT